MKTYVFIRFDRMYERDRQTDIRLSQSLTIASRGSDNFGPIYRFICEMMQDRAIVTMKGEQETAPELSNGISLNDIE